MKQTAPFNGFPEAGTRFLSDLAENNNRDWFEANKAVYQQELLSPAVAFVAALGEALQAVAPGVQYDTRTNGSGSLMRIYRDVRFSKDKSPYKSSIAGYFWQGAGKKTACPAFGFHFEAARIALMAGLFSFQPDRLHLYRRAVDEAESGEQLQQIVSNLTAVESYVVAGEQLKRVPAGYPADHPRADLLRYKGIYAHPLHVSNAAMHSAELVDVCLAHFAEMAPLQQWLVSYTAS